MQYVLDQALVHDWKILHINEILNYAAKSSAYSLGEHNLRSGYMYEVSPRIKMD